MLTQSPQPITARAAPACFALVWQPLEAVMKRVYLSLSALALACLALGACQDRREPVKPTVDLSLASPLPART